MQSNPNGENLAVKMAADHCGGFAALAKIIGVTDEAVRQWAAGKVTLSGERCLQIESATAGKITREQLRPDLFVREAA